MDQRSDIVIPDGFIYIASPYSKSSAEKREQRYKAVCAVCAYYVKVKHETVYSPIAHWHPIAKSFGLPIDMNFWRPHDLAILQFAKKMVIACIGGWKESDGIEEEIEYCRLAPAIPVEYFDIERLKLDA